MRMGEAALQQGNGGGDRGEAAGQSARGGVGGRFRLEMLGGLPAAASTA